jgi:sugar phosphate permease
MAIALIAKTGWRVSFWIFGTLGIFWAAAWWKWFRDDPAQHPGPSNAEELKIIRQSQAPQAKHQTIEWHRLLNTDLLFICLTYFAFGYGLYFYLTWLPTYFREARGFSAKRGECSIQHCPVEWRGSQHVGRAMDGSLVQEIRPQGRTMRRSQRYIGGERGSCLPLQQ